MFFQQTTKPPELLIPKTETITFNFAPSLRVTVSSPQQARRGGNVRTKEENRPNWRAVPTDSSRVPVNSETKFAVPTDPSRVQANWETKFAVSPECPWVPTNSVPVPETKDAVLLECARVQANRLGTRGAENQDTALGQNPQMGRTASREFMEMEFGRDIAYCTQFGKGRRAL